MNLFIDIANQYRSFAREAQESPCFEQWTLGVAGDEKVKAWIAELPQIKQQPNLVLAAARWHGAPAPGPYAGLRELLSDQGSIMPNNHDSLDSNERGRPARNAHGLRPN